MADIKKLLKDLEKARKDGELSSDDLDFLSNLGNANITSRIQDVNNDELNAVGQNYSDNAYSTATKKRELEYDTANKLQNIEENASNIKEARSDETRQELLENTKDYRDKQEQRYKDVQDIVATQQRIANRQANIETAKAGRYGDIYSDSTVQNIKNDVINRYAQNIANAQQYALSNNRAIDQDVLNVGLTEVNDKNTRDAFKDALLDKNNSYILDAIKLARDGDKKAIEDVENFFQSVVRQRGEDALTRSSQTQKREFYEKEFSSLNNEGKAQMLRDFAYNVPGYSLVADYIPRMIERYPNLSLSELVGKMNKAGEYALSNKQLVQSLSGTDPTTWTEEQRKAYNYFIEEGYNRLVESNRTYPETIEENMNNTDRDGTNKTYNTNNYDRNKDIQASVERAENEKKGMYNNSNSTDNNSGLYDNATNNQAKQDMLNTGTYNAGDSTNVGTRLSLSEFVKDENNRKRLQKMQDNFMNNDINLSDENVQELSRILGLELPDTRRFIEYLQEKKQAKK